MIVVINGEGGGGGIFVACRNFERVNCSVVKQNCNLVTGSPTGSLSSSRCTVRKCLV